MGAYSGPSARSTHLWVLIGPSARSSHMWVLIVVLQLGVPICGCL